MIKNSEVNKLLLTLNINLSNAYYKINSIEYSLQYATDGINTDNNSFKAHYRAGLS